jgi:hypothetical protein
MAVLCSLLVVAMVTGILTAEAAVVRRIAVEDHSSGI